MKLWILTQLLKHWPKSFLHFVLLHYPFQVTTRVDQFRTILIKKGRRKQWITYDAKGNRMPSVMK